MSFIILLNVELERTRFHASIANLHLDAGDKRLEAAKQRSITEQFLGVCVELAGRREGA